MHPQSPGREGSPDTLLPGLLQPKKKLCGLWKGHEAAPGEETACREPRDGLGELPACSCEPAHAVSKHPSGKEGREVLQMLC